MTSAPTTITLTAGTARATVVPAAGGRVGSLTVHGVDLLITGTPDDHPMLWGSFPMIPWAGRVRHGRFTHDGTVHELPLALPPHAIHGTVYDRPWQVAHADATSVVLTAALADAWPLGGSAEQEISLHPDRLVCRATVTAAERSMPAQIGWHPWFTKPRTADLRFRAMLRRDDEGIPTGEQVAPPPPGPWDDCFVDPLAPLTLVIDDLTVTVASDCSHWVVYDQPAHGTCVEPQSGPPDGFTLAPLVLAPGASLTRHMTIAWT